MAETPSNMLPLNSPASPFTLFDTCSQKKVSLEDLKGVEATVIMFLCNHCPYVKHIQKKLVQVAEDYQERGVGFIAISSNDVNNYPQDGPDKMKEEAINHHYPFPYLYDETQAVAKAYQAACTPDFYIFDAELKCVYRGRFDDSTPGNNKPVTGTDLCEAMDQVLMGQAVSDKQYPSLGCNIKWR